MAVLVEPGGHFPFRGASLQALPPSGFPPASPLYLLKYRVLPSSCLAFPHHQPNARREGRTVCPVLWGRPRGPAHRKDAVCLAGSETDQVQRQTPGSPFKSTLPPPPSDGGTTYSGPQVSSGRLPLTPHLRLLTKFYLKNQFPISVPLSLSNAPPSFQTPTTPTPQGPASCFPLVLLQPLLRNNCEFHLFWLFLSVPDPYALAQQQQQEMKQCSEC